MCLPYAMTSSDQLIDPVVIFFDRKIFFELLKIQLLQ